MASPLVEPLIPDAQKNRSPDLLLEGARTGLAAAVQLSQQRRQSEQALAHMALQEKLAAQEHDLSAEKMAEDYSLRSRHLDNEEALIPARKAALEATADWNRLTKGATIRQRTAQISTLNDFNQQVAKYGLDDPNPDPVQFYASARRLNDEFAWANIPAIKQTLKDINLRTKQHTVPLQINAPFKDDDGNTVIKPVTKQVPVGEIIEGLADENKKDSVLKILEASGLVESLDKKTKKTIPASNSAGNASLRKYIQAETARAEAGRNTDFSRGRTRVPPGGPASTPAVDLPDSSTPSYAPMTAPADATPDAAVGGGAVDDESNLFGSIGETEKYLTQARNALKLGAHPKAVAQMLNGFGVDPSQMWA